MISSDHIQTPVEASSMELLGLRIFATRDGDRVTGRVDFPYEVNGRKHRPIDYHSRRPPPPAIGRR